jgi:putative intracellular protease/amidase
VRPTVDQVSLDPQRVGGKRNAADLQNYIDSIESELAQPMAVEDAAERTDAYDAVYIPGGHGPMEDLSGCAARRGHY